MSDKHAYEQLLALSKFLIASEVDMRHLIMLKACFNSKEKGQLIESVPLSLITEYINKTFA